MPLLVQQFCELWLPERLLERLCKEDAPAAELEQALNVFCLLSSCQCGQVRRHQVSLGAGSTACQVGMLRHLVDTAFQTPHYPQLECA